MRVELTWNIGDKVVTTKVEGDSASQVKELLDFALSAANVNEPITESANNERAIKIDTTVAVQPSYF